MKHIEQRYVETPFNQLHTRSSSEQFCDLIIALGQITYCSLAKVDGNGKKLHTAEVRIHLTIVFLNTVVFLCNYKTVTLKNIIRVQTFILAALLSFLFRDIVKTTYLTIASEPLDRYFAHLTALCEIEYISERIIPKYCLRTTPNIVENNQENIKYATL